MKIASLILSAIVVVSFSACSSKPQSKEECTTCPIKKALGMGCGQADAQKKPN